MAANGMSSGDEWWIFAFPVFATDCSWVSAAGIVAGFLIIILASWAAKGGPAWANSSTINKIPGPRGLPILGIMLSIGDVAHRRLADLAEKHNAKELMACSMGSTRLIVTSMPHIAREILNSSAFADRPLKQSAQELLFGRAIGFAPYGQYWRNLRRIAANHMFSPMQIAKQASIRQSETNNMIQKISAGGAEGVEIREYLRQASLRSIMRTVFGRVYEGEEAAQLEQMVREGFEVLGAFNWADHLPALRILDPQSILRRCSKLVPRVEVFVHKILHQHRFESASTPSHAPDFVDVLLNLQSQEKFQDSDIVAILWEMIFRGVDTTAIVAEWTMAELVLHPEIQFKVHQELDQVVGKHNAVLDSHIPNLLYLQAVVKESMRLHPPGPLLSWARLSTSDVNIGGHFIPSGTTAMVNMWSITHDPCVWEDPLLFNPDRFVKSEFDIKGADLRLAPFGAGRRVCPGRALGLATIHTWLAILLHHFVWIEDPQRRVDLTEVLKLSCEMVHPLFARPLCRINTPLSS